MLAKAQLKPRAADGAAPLAKAVGHVAGVPAGRPICPADRAFMEPRLGHDFSRVRVHADSSAAAAQSVDARAYTLGQDIVFGAGQYAPGTAQGRRLLAHELTHVVQQGGGNIAGPRPGPLAGNQPGDALERAADAAAGRVMGGMPPVQSLTPVGPLLQRQTPGGDAGKPPPEKKEAGEVVTEGLKTVAEQAATNNPQVKKVIIDPIKGHLKAQWERFSTGEKVGVVGFGAGALGMAGGALLSDPSGRRQLEGLNLAAPFTLIPYMPLETFKYTLPTGEGPDQRLFKFDTGFNADDLINLRTESRGLPKMSLRVNMQWGYDPSTDRLTVLGGDASLGLVPGLSISGGAYKNVLTPPQMFMGQEGQMVESRQSIPGLDKPEPIPDVRVMLQVDLLKFKPGDFVRQVQSFF